MMYVHTYSRNLENPAATTFQMFRIQFHGLAVSMGMVTLWVALLVLSCLVRDGSAVVNPTVLVWGQNEQGQLMLGDTVQRTTPTLLLPTNTQLQNEIATAFVTSESLHSFLLVGSGAVYVGGDNTFGKLGLGDTVSRSTPTLLRSGHVSTLSVVAASLMRESSLMLTSSGKIFAAGDNAYGQLGTGDSLARVTPTLVATSVIVSSTSAVTRTTVSSGHFHTAIIATTGQIYTMGRNNVGQLGVGDTTNRAHPVAVAGVLGSNVTTFSIGHATSVASGAFHSIALSSMGKVFTWGFNDVGQLGIGMHDVGNVTTPTLVLGALASASRWSRTVSASARHSTITEGWNHAIYVMGSNHHGQLGLGTIAANDFRFTPTLMLGATTSLVVTQVVAGTARSFIVGHGVGQTIDARRVYVAGGGAATGLGIGAASSATTWERTTPTLVTTQYVPDAVFGNGWSSALIGNIACPPNTYNDIQFTGQCRSCGPNRMSNGGATASVCKALPGYTGQDGASRRTTACVAGRYKTAAGSAACTSCFANTFMWSYTSGSSSVSECLACGANRQSSPASVEPSSCLANAGYVGNNGTASSVAPCRPGTYKTSVGTMNPCDSCALNTYSTTSGASSSAYCLACGIGKVTLATGGNNSFSCLANQGYTGDNGATAATPCNLGTYKDAVGPAACTGCQRGSYSSINGATTSLTCKPCGDDRTSAVASLSTTDCRANIGYTGGDGTSAVAPCLAGTFKGDVGQAPCDPCPVGRFAPGVQSSRCQACPVGRYADAMGAWTCKPCSVGTYSNQFGASRCLIASAGTYIDSVGASASVDCPKGTYSPNISATTGLACVSCPTQSTSHAASTNIGACVCRQGWARVGDACEMIAWDVANVVQSNPSNGAMNTLTFTFRPSHTLTQGTTIYVMGLTDVQSSSTPLLEVHGASAALVGNTAAWYRQNGTLTFTLVTTWNVGTLWRRQQGRRGDSESSSSSQSSAPTQALRASDGGVIELIVVLQNPAAGVGSTSPYVSLSPNGPRYVMNGTAPVGIGEWLQTDIAESSTEPAAANTITVVLRFSLSITVGSEIELFGFSRSPTPTQGLLISHGSNYFLGSGGVWNKEQGTFALTVRRHIPALVAFDLSWQIVNPEVVGCGSRIVVRCRGWSCIPTPLTGYVLAGSSTWRSVHVEQSSPKPWWRNRITLQFQSNADICDGGSVTVIGVRVPSDVLNDTTVTLHGTAARHFGNVVQWKVMSARVDNHPNGRIVRQGELSLSVPATTLSGLTSVVISRMTEITVGIDVVNPGDCIDVDVAVAPSVVAVNPTTASTGLPNHQIPMLGNCDRPNTVSNTMAWTLVVTTVTGALTAVVTGSGVSGACLSVAFFAVGVKPMALEGSTLDTASSHLLWVAMEIPGAWATALLGSDVEQHWLDAGDCFSSVPMNDNGVDNGTAQVNCDIDDLHYCFALVSGYLSFAIAMGAVMVFSLCCLRPASRALEQSIERRRISAREAASFAPRRQGGSTHDTHTSDVGSEAGDGHNHSMHHSSSSHFPRYEVTFLLLALFALSRLCGRSLGAPAACGNWTAIAGWSSLMVVVLPSLAFMHAWTLRKTSTVADWHQAASARQAWSVAKERYSAIKQSTRGLGMHSDIDLPIQRNVGRGILQIVRTALRSRWHGVWKPKTASKGSSQTSLDVQATKALQRSFYRAVSPFCGGFRVGGLWFIGVRFFTLSTIALVPGIAVGKIGLTVVGVTLCVYALLCVHSSPFISRSDCIVEPMMAALQAGVMAMQWCVVDERLPVETADSATTALLVVMVIFAVVECFGVWLTIGVNVASSLYFANSKDDALVATTYMQDDLHGHADRAVVCDAYWTMPNEHAVTIDLPHANGSTLGAALNVFQGVASQREVSHRHSGETIPATNVQPSSDGRHSGRHRDMSPVAMSLNPPFTNVRSNTNYRPQSQRRSQDRRKQHGQQDPTGNVMQRDRSTQLLPPPPPPLSLEEYDQVVARLVAQGAAVIGAPKPQQLPQLPHTSNTADAVQDSRGERRRGVIPLPHDPGAVPPRSTTSSATSIDRRARTRSGARL